MNEDVNILADDLFKWWFESGGVERTPGQHCKDMAKWLIEDLGYELPGSAEQAWDDGFEAGHLWEQVGPAGIPHDPPRNPHYRGPWH